MKQGSMVLLDRKLKQLRVHATEKQMDAVNAENQNLGENQALSDESLILLKIELPHLLKEWNSTLSDKVSSSTGLKNL